VRKIPPPGRFAVVRKFLGLADGHHGSAFLPEPIFLLRQVT
jgi:hypothetical protein